MIKNFIINFVNVLFRHVHIRVVFPKLLIYPYRRALVVPNLDIMLKIRLPLLIIP
jgi:hypothetical protein